ncbi:MAG: toxic anion resistance protein, partial [Oscillospiraceae bacterium]|nr:toxic anion resistance protein [Oscillospiraceae bacterium]
DKMYEMNLAYFKELTMYILAGQLKCQELRETELPALQQKAQESGLPEDAQAASDFANMIGRFEKRLHDLELTRIISLQMSPQIRLIQNNDSLMAEKIQTSIVNTIPLWKSQMVMALSMEHSKQAMAAQREVSDLTNELLKKNAEALHQGSVDVARESERGIVELETLRHTNEELINTLEEVRQIQEDGRARRAEAEAELGRIEGELKQKLLEIRG